MFLSLGFEATSCEQVAAQAGCGKASIYARYANKGELFAATIRHLLATSDFTSTEAAPRSPRRDRLISVCGAVLEAALSARAVQFKRLLVAEASRFPDLVARTAQDLRARAVSQLARALDGGTTDPTTPAWAVAAKLIDVASTPLELSALLGEELPAVRSRVPSQVEAAVTMLTRAGVLNKP